MVRRILLYVILKNSEIHSITWVNEFHNDLTTYVIIIITQKDIKTIMLWNYDARSISSSPRIVISCLCIFLNKIVVYYFKGIVNVIIHALRKYK